VLRGRGARKRACAWRVEDSARRATLLRANHGRGQLVGPHHSSSRNSLRAGWARVDAARGADGPDERLHLNCAHKWERNVTDWDMRPMSAPLRAAAETRRSGIGIRRRAQACRARAPTTTTATTATTVNIDGLCGLSPEDHCQDQDDAVRRHQLPTSKTVSQTQGFQIVDAKNWAHSPLCC